MCSDLHPDSYLKGQVTGDQTTLYFLFSHSWPVVVYDFGQVQCTSQVERKTKCLQKNNVGRYSRPLDCLVILSFAIFVFSPGEETVVKRTKIAVTEVCNWVLDWKMLLGVNLFFHKLKYSHLKFIHYKTCFQANLLQFTLNLSSVNTRVFKQFHLTVVISKLIQWSPSKSNPRKKSV
mgnify:FL=1